MKTNERKDYQGIGEEKVFGAFFFIEFPEVIVWLSLIKLNKYRFQKYLWKALRNLPAELKECLPLKLTVENKSKQNQVCRANDKIEKKQHTHVKTKAQKHGSR